MHQIKSACSWHLVHEYHLKTACTVCIFKQKWNDIGKKNMLSVFSRHCHVQYVGDLFRKWMYRHICKVIIRLSIFNTSAFTEWTSPRMEAALPLCKRTSGNTFLRVVVLGNEILKRGEGGRGEGQNSEIISLKHWNIQHWRCNISSRGKVRLTHRIKQSYR